MECEKDEIIDNKLSKLERNERECEGVGDSEKKE